MLRKTIKFEGFEGETNEETFYFHLSEPEIAEMELSVEGGLSKRLRRISAATTSAEAIPLFKDIISRSVGRQSEDGKRFMKSPEITAEFMESGAWPALFMELLQTPAKAAEFIVACLPRSVGARVDKSLILSEAGLSVPEVVAVENPDDTETSSTTEKTLHDYTQAELIEMPADKFRSLVGTDDPLKMDHAALLAAFQRKMHQ